MVTTYDPSIGPKGSFKIMLKSILVLKVVRCEMIANILAYISLVSETNPFKVVANIKV